MQSLRKHFLLACTLAAYSFVFAAPNNKGGKLQIADIMAWQRESLVYDMDSLWREPIITTIKPKEGKTFLIVSAQLKFDWSDFPDATQYFLDTREIFVRSENDEYKPIGLYKKGGRYSDFLSTHLYPQKNTDGPYYLDIVFCVSSEDKELMFYTAETKTRLTLQGKSREPEKIPATFEITHAEMIDKLVALVKLNGLFARKAQENLNFETDLLTGKILKLSLKITATGYYAENQEGLYNNDRLTIGSHRLGIWIPEKGYFPAAGSFRGDKVGHCVIVEPKHTNEKPFSECTLLFCVPNDISTFDLLYNKQPVIKQYTAKPTLK